MRRKTILKTMLLKTIDESLNRTLGESAKESFFLYVKAKSNIEKDTITRDLEAFSTCLKNLFGEPALLIETLIVKRFHEEARVQYVENTAFSFKDYIEDVEKKVVKG